MNEQRPSISALTRDLVGKFKRYIREPKLFLADIGLSGARVVGTSRNGNTLLSLNTRTPLGPRGTIVALPRDRVVFESVRQEGCYSPDVSLFLQQGLDGATQPGTRCALLDIGANTGLVTLQAMNLARDAHTYFLFEPLPQHVEAMRHNLKTSSIPLEIHIRQVALSAHNGKSTIFTEQLNRGNSSLLQEAITYPEEQIETEVKSVDTSEFFQGFADSFDRLVIKSDTQGMDALILARIPEKMWARVERLAVEVWALPHTEESDVRQVIEMCRDFARVSWEPELSRNVQLHEVFDFWTSKTSRERNLFLSRT